MRPLSYKGTNAVVICFDIMTPESLFNAVCKWHPEIVKHCPGCPIILAGCKMDQRIEYKKDRCFNESTDGSVENPVSHEKHFCDLKLPGKLFPAKNPSFLFFHYASAKNLPFLVSFGRLKYETTGTMAASQMSAQAYVECSAKINSPGVREVFEMAGLAAIGKLNLQKSYVDLSSTVRRKSISTSLQTRMRRSQSVNGSLRVRASTVEEDEDKKCAIM
ncbi:putative rho-related GTP-binding protein RhoE-like [Apostichopus japonicus]|uniref:Putative rho-related GTP-binding protein RhoE-like n=1 Tax=Stichopus japonicus TaxID=307972 RepID=A0A2G8L8S7_STIJA|nr:putative rho-related GTP-binding protein RhoE-like [Apostichopus japonicus]